MKTYKTQPARCPDCGIRPTRATFAYSFPLKQAPKKPTAGSVGICWNCGAVNIYADDLGNLRTPTTDERAMLVADKRIEKMSQSIKERLINEVNRR